MSQELYTRLFLNIPISYNELIKSVSVIFSGIVEMRTVICENIEFVVCCNEYHDDIMIKANPDDFIHFPYTIEAVSINDISLSKYLEYVSTLMKEIEKNNGIIVAACDWEDELPGGGKLGL